MGVNPLSVCLMNQEKKVTKEEFKLLYFKYATPFSGWTESYWDKFFEKEENKKYFFTEPNSPKENRMYIGTDGENRRLYFLTEEGDESLYDFPGKE